MKSLQKFNIWMSKTKTYAKVLKQRFYGKSQREIFVKFALSIGNWDEKNLSNHNETNSIRILSLRSEEWRSKYLLKIPDNEINYGRNVKSYGRSFSLCFILRIVTFKKKFFVYRILWQIKLSCSIRHSIGTLEMDFEIIFEVSTFFLSK